MSDPPSLPDVEPNPEQADLERQLQEASDLEDALSREYVETRGKQEEVKQGCLQMEVNIQSAYTIYNNARNTYQMKIDELNQLEGLGNLIDDMNRMNTLMADMSELIEGAEPRLDYMMRTLLIEREEAERLRMRGNAIFIRYEESRLRSDMLHRRLQLLRSSHA